MSDSLQDAKDVLRDGRKNKLSNTAQVKIEVSIKDQIPLKLAKKLRKDKVGMKLNEIWRKAQSNRQEWMDRLTVYQQDFDEFKHTHDYGGEPTESVSPEGVSQLHVPMPITVIKNVHARFMQALTADLNPVVQARREDGVERAAMIKDLMAYTLKDWANHYQGVEGVLDKFVWDWVSMGDAILKVRWETEYDTFQDVGNFVEADIPVEGVDKEGNIVKLPNARIQQEEVRRLITTFDGPVFENRDLEDIIMVGDSDPQRASYVFDAYRLNSSQLYTLEDQKLFDGKAVAEVIEAGPDAKTGKPEDEIKQRRKENAGEAGLNAEASLPDYRILEVYFGYDVDGSGIHSQLVAWIHPSSGTILRATYLNRTNKAGERPYFKASYMERKGAEHGLGLLEMLHPLSIEMDFHHNARIDFGLLAAMPFGFYRANSSIDPEKFRMSPGDLFPVDDPKNDVFYPNLGNRTTFLIRNSGTDQPHNRHHHGYPEHSHSSHFRD